MAGVLWVAARSRDLLAGGAASFALWRFNRPERPKAQLFHPEFFNLNDGVGEDSEGGGGGDVRVAKPQTAVVIGAGTVGVSLAYQLARRGYNVAVIDAASEVSAECSAAAAGGMARSNAIVSRGTWADVSSAIANSFSMCMRMPKMVSCSYARVHGHSSSRTGASRLMPKSRFGLAGESLEWPTAQAIIVTPHKRLGRV
jgi:xanthine/CO dehydrogenase XdhC/CoxF family maturation factor